jgi:hypothetical protein
MAKDNLPILDNSIHIEIEGTKDAQQLSLDDKVQVVIKGKVEGIDQRLDFDDPDKKISVIRLSNYSSKIIGHHASEFEDLIED